MKKIPEDRHVCAASVAFLTFLVYLASLQNGFVWWDDSKYVFANPHIQALDMSFFRWAFFDFYAANWHPLTWISHALDYSIWGLNPLGHHLTNIILHTANTFIVVLLAVKLIEAPHRHQPSAVSCQSSAFSLRPSTFALIAAVTTGLLFGLHPVHVESVAWVAERKDLLCALFYLLSVMMYVKYATHVSQRAKGVGQEEAKGIEHGAEGKWTKKKNFRLYALCFFVLALMSKPMAVSLPFVLLILDWYPLKRIASLSTFRTALMEKIPFILLSLVSSLLTILAQKSGGAIQSLDFAPLLSRLLVALRSLIAYLWKMLLPLDLVPYYPYPRNVSPLSLEYLSAFVLVLGITAVCVALRRKHKIPLAVWFFYVATLVPVLGIVQVGGQAMADRYTYLPSLGPFLLVGLSAAWVAEKIHTVKRVSSTAQFAGVITSLVLLFFLTFLTLRQIAIWKNTFTLWNYVIAKDPKRVPEAYNNRGLAFSDNGQLNEAIEDYTRAIAINPLYSEARLNRAVAFTSMDQIDKAIEDYTVVIISNPFDQVYYLRGAAYEKKGQTDKAIEDYTQAIALKPSYTEAHIRLGILYGRSGAFDKAIDQFERALAVNPGYSLTYVNRGYAYSLMGRYPEALRDFDKAIELDRGNPGTYMSRGRVYLKMGDRETAVSDFRKACDLGDREGCSLVHEAGLPEGKKQR